MSKFKRLARIAAGVLLATGMFAATAAPADAAQDSTRSPVALFDTGWG